MSEENNFHCLIVDDEPLARELVRTHLDQMERVATIHECSNAIEASGWMKKHPVDIVFLDIEMPEINGLDFIRSMDVPPKIIITTAYSEFAIEGFELAVSDYLLKPITFHRFKTAYLKVQEALINEQILAKVEGDYIMISSSHELIKVPFNEILFIEGLHKYVKIVSEHKTYTTLKSLTSMEEELNNQFFRCHRSFIVHLSKINRLKGNNLQLNEHEIPVSKQKKGELMDRMKR